MELVVFSRATPKESFPIGNNYGNIITAEDFQEICQNKAYDESRNFQNLIWEEAEKYRLALFHK